MADPPSSSNEDPRTDGDRRTRPGLRFPRSRHEPAGSAPALSAHDYVRAIIESFPFPAWVKDTSGRFVAVNRRFAEFVGLAGPGQAIGLTDFDFALPPLAERYQADDREVMSTGEAKSIEEFLESGGRAMWVESFKAPVKAPDGSVVGTYGFSREITARRRAQNLLEIQRDLGLALVEAPDAERTYRVLLDHALRLPDIQGAGIVRGPPRWRVRAPCAQRVHRRVREQGARDAGEHLRRSGAFTAGRTLRTWEDFGPDLTSVLREEGLRAVVVLPIAEGGCVSGCLSLASRTQDAIDNDAILALEAMCAHVGHVLQRLRAQSALKESEARWGFALEGAGDGVWDWHVPSGKVFYSRRWKEMLGYAERRDRGHARGVGLTRASRRSGERRDRPRPSLSPRAAPLRHRAPAPSQGRQLHVGARSWARGGMGPGRRACPGHRDPDRHLRAQARGSGAARERRVPARRHRIDLRRHPRRGRARPGADRQRAVRGVVAHPYGHARVEGRTRDARVGARPARRPGRASGHEWPSCRTRNAIAST